jgi:hypothetical protein
LLAEFLCWFYSIYPSVFPSNRKFSLAASVCCQYPEKGSDFLQRVTGLINRGSVAEIIKHPDFQPFHRVANRNTGASDRGRFTDKRRQIVPASAEVYANVIQVGKIYKPVQHRPMGLHGYACAVEPDV